jgi:hypothetical protein
MHLAMPVRIPAVPEQHEGSAEMASEVPEKFEDVRAADVLAGMERQIEGDAPAARRHDECADRRDLFVGAGPDGQERGLPPERPGAAEQRGHQKPRFVQADQARAESSRFFLSPCPVMLDPHPHPLIDAFLGRPLGTLWCEPASAEKPAHVIWMIPDMKVIADELRDPATGPERGRIAECLWTAQDPPRECLTLSHGQLRRTTGSSASQDSLAPLAQVRPLPAPHRSAADTDHPGDNHRLQPLLQQCDGTQATAFQLRRTPLWAHVAPPQESLGLYLYRRQ